MFLISWIDKDLNQLRNDYTFKRYFDAIEEQKIEDSYYLVNVDSGIDTVYSLERILQSIHLFSKGDEMRPYQGKIPFDLNFKMSQLEVIKTLGSPEKEGGGYRDIWGKVPPWGKYIFNNYSLHVQYSEDGGNISLFTIGSLALEPYFDARRQ